jgi:hypothetical protein
LGHVACMGHKCVHCLVGTCEGKRLLRKPMIWKTKGDGMCGEGAFWTGYIRGSGVEHLAFSVSVLCTGEQLALCSSCITPWEITPCVQWLGHSCPGDEYGRPSFCRLCCGYPMHGHLLYQATTTHMCHEQISVNIVTFHLYCVCMCRCARAQLCVLKWNKNAAFSYGSLQMFYMSYKL